MRRILFLTGNLGKLAEARKHLAPLGWQVEQFLVDGEVPEIIEPQADSLNEVAEAKMRQAVALAGDSLGADGLLLEDSGLFIDSQGGFPGVYSAPILQQIGLEGILRLMAGVEQREAEFRASALLYLNGEYHTSTGVCRGKIAHEVRGEGGFGYDPLFIPDGGDGDTFGEMSSEEKGGFSHRAAALDGLERALS